LDPSDLVDLGLIAPAARAVHPVVEPMDLLSHAWAARGLHPHSSDTTQSR